MVLSFASNISSTITISLFLNDVKMFEMKIQILSLLSPPTNISRVAASFDFKSGLFKSGKFNDISTSSIVFGC